ncbi:non-ribosomal peptide synthetase [Myxococcus sp. RHSTA-1-4]|uniref:non-ribosomal peptide synthetase n=1 Tax=Myxococcus sp. RHSTA-1-4 TaxID=2874601 RepID=UPI0021032F98|nr:non-ribosomal peptide synthetase [Myxococcus sp. RHSTA-1-4]
MLETRARTLGEQPLYTFLEDGGDDTVLSYAALDLRARRIGAALQSLARAGERAVLLYPPGLEYVAGFFGCLYAGLVAVPAYPPDPSRLDRTLPRLRAIIRDARASVVLTTAFIQEMGEGLFEGAPELAALRWVATDALPDGTEAGWQRPDPRWDTLAFLQYTSGSTGDPKGVRLSHGNLLHNLGLISHAFEVRDDSAGVIWLPPYHDMGLIGGILQPLYAGFPVALMSPLAFLRRPRFWLESLTRFGGTISGGPCFAFDLCVRKVPPGEREGLDLRRWELAFCGAEPIRPEVMSRFAEAFAPAGFQAGAFYPCYGLAEGTLIASGGRKGGGVLTRSWDAAALERNEALEAPEGSGSRPLVGCGRTMPDQTLLVVDPDTRRACPPERVGEIWVSGPSVAHGYWERPEESEATFGATLADDASGQRFLRTGDLGLLRDGELFVVGRRKDLIILRGRNLHPQDLELTLERSHPALRPGCGAAFSIEVGGEERLAVMYEVDPRKAWTPEDVVAAVRRGLSEAHEVQLHTLVLIEPGALPKTSSGKIQRRACRAELLAGTARALLTWSESDAGGAEAPERAGTPGEMAPPAPSTVEELEAWLLARIASRLRVRPESLARDVPITSFGLDSLGAVELANDLESLGTVLRMEVLLQGPTVAELARKVFEARGAAALPELVPGTGAEPAPLTSAQQRLWLFEQLERGNPAYHLPAAVRLTGKLDEPALRSAFEAITQRHLALRAVFREEDGTPSQITRPEVSPWFSRVDLRAVPVAGREEAALRLAREAARAPFDLTKGPVLRTTLIQLDEHEHLLVVVMHHIASDGGSFAILARELSALYAACTAGREATLPPLPLQYPDFARWRRERDEEAARSASMEWWKQRLAGAPAALELPVDHPRPPMPSYRGGRISLHIPEPLTARLEALGRDEGATLFMTLLAAFQVLLARHSGQEDLCIGTPVNGRDRAGLEGLIGCFLDLLVLRGSLAGAPRFRELLGRTREVTLDAFAHRGVPFERVVDAVQPARDRSRAPLFQVLFVLQPEPGAGLALPGLESRRAELDPGATPYDLTLSLARGANGLEGWLEYATDLFEPATAARMAQRLQVLLDAIASGPDQRVSALSLLPEAERRQLLVDWNDTRTDFPDACIHTLIEARAARAPETVAVRCGDEALTWRELDRRANALARRLREQGVGPECVVGFCADRSVDLVVGLLGILKAGGAYLPLDPAYPEARLALMLEDAAAPVVLAHRHLASAFQASGRAVVLLDPPGGPEEADAAPACGVGPGNLAYILYTSGSTGRPKGVLIPHRNVVSFFAGMDARIGATPGTWLAVTSVSFDISVLELLWTLARGFKVVVQGEKGALAAETLPTLIRGHGITHLQVTPSLAHALLLEPDAPGALAGLERMLVGGEALPMELAARLRDTVGGALLNMYGPTETTIWSSTHRVGTEQGTVPIGTPIANTSLLVLDAGLRPAPVGVPGELFIGGAGVARGYHARPELTAERFLPDPYGDVPGARMYRTGDRARWRADGTVEFLGRVDHQLKVRGFRVEPGEIEAALARHPGVGQVVVVAREDVPGGARLVAYVVPQPGAALSEDALRAFARQALPEHMVPSAIVRLDALPLTPNGKVDRKALPAPEGVRAAAREYVAPRTETERRLTELWSSLLGVRQVGVEDDFFSLGGDSILALRIVARARQAGLHLTARQLFQHPTVAGLAQVVGNAGPVAGWARDEAGTAGTALSPVQQGLLFQVLLEPGTEAYFEQLSWTLAGPLDVDALRRAWAVVVERHGALRTSFRWQGLEAPLQVVHAQVALPWLEQDWRSVPADEQRRMLEDFLRDDRARGFDLTHAPLLRLALIRLEEGSWRCVWSFHHLLLDGWSIARVLGEVLDAYGVLASGGTWRPSAAMDFRAYVEWLKHRRPEQDESFWRDQLAGIDSPTPLPAEGGTPATRETGECEVSLDEADTSALQDFARRHGLTPSTLVHGAWALLLSRYGGGADVVFGTALSGRPAELPGIDEAVGLFIHSLPVRARVRLSEKLVPWLRELHAVLMELSQREHVPLPLLQGWSEVPRGAHLFESLLAFENYPLDSALTRGAAGLEVRDVRVFERTHYPLTAVALPGRTLRLKLQYRLERIQEEAAARLLKHWRTLLRGMIAEPEQRLGDVSLLSETERRRVLVEWNATRTAYPRAATVHALFEAQAGRMPEAVAVVYGGAALTYAELDQRANRLAHRLHALGAGRGSTVGLCVERSAELVVGMLAILKAGAAYVPLDPAYPRERLAWMLADAGAPVLLTQERLRGTLPVEGVRVLALDGEGVLDGMPATAPESGAGAEDAAYVIYTSGSTGTPKGVCVPHRAVVRLVVETDFIQWSPDDRVAQASNASFDAATFEVWGALLNGARLVGVDRETALAPRAFATWLREQDIRVLFLTTAWFNQVAAEVPDAFRGLRQLHFGGEAVDPRPVRQVLREGPPERLLHVYGPTESTTFSTWHLITEVPEGATTLPIGRPLANTEQYVLDVALAPVPPGGVGELWLGGDGLAWGYLGRPELTAERFVPHPFSTTPGARLYRTGDRVRLLPDGAVSFVGRVDTQVKVRGFRVEPGEVEAALLRHPEVRQAAVLAREDAVGGSRRLVAYVVPSAEGAAPPSPAVLREFLTEHLPAYMVPSAFMVLERLPLTPNGKVDRRALPEPTRFESAEETSAGSAAPRGPEEELLAGLFEELLGVSHVGAYDSFFDLGGHSLLATRVVARIQATFGVSLSLRDLFEDPTVGRLAERIRAARQANGAVRLPPIVPVPRECPLPLSAMQERLWLLEQLQPGTALYNVVWAAWLEGPLDVPAFERALSALFRRHEAPRTTFSSHAGDPVQVIHPEVQVSLPVVDLLNVAEAEREAEALRAASEEARRPFSLADGPLFRALLLRTGETKHLLVLTLHHIISDGWSLGVVTRELAALYGAELHGRPSPLPEPSLQPADHAVWQREWLKGESLEAQLRYWRKQLAGAPPVLELPTDFPRPSLQRFRGDTLRVHLPAELSERFRALCRHEGVTPFMGLLAAFQLLLSRVSGQEDVCVGSPIAGRHHPGLEDLIGFFVNTLVLRTRLGGNPTFRELLHQVRETTLDAYAHQDVPFEKLVEALQPPRSLSHAPLVQVVLALNEGTRWDAPEGLAMRPVELASGTAKFDLTLSLFDSPDGLSGTLEYDADLFTPATASRLMSQLRVLLEGAVADAGQRVGDLPMMDSAERQRLLVEWNDTRAEYPREACLAELFEAQAARTPDAVAAECVDSRLTYGELDRRANQLAWYLRKHGVGQGTPVGLCVQRSLELVVGMLGILKAGGAYVPLDPTYPRERLAFMVEDTRLPVVLAQRSVLELLPSGSATVVLLDEAWSDVAREPESSPSIRVPAESLAYVMYTSGSTGRPKGVCVPQRAVARLVLGSRFARFGPEEVFLQLAPICFDAATLELWGALLHGARLVLFPPTTPTVDSLKDVLVRHGVTTLWLTAALFEAISAARPDALDGVRQLLAGGDVLPPAVVRERLARGGIMVNGYGPTEGTTFTCCHVMEGSIADGPVPIGRPIANTRVYVVDRGLRLVPPGVPGELLIGGDGLAWGYLGRPELTAERFIPDAFGPESGGRLYRTGDQVRYREDGTLEFLGRMDAQVKVRGYRVEPGEVEEALRKHPAVAEAVVVAKPDPAGGKRLVAYAVPRHGETLEPRALRTFLAESLPEFMVPSALVPLAALPLTPVGKLDRAALPEPDVARPSGSTFAEPTTALERRLAELWAKVLGVERVGVEDHFFADLGGSSMSVVKACALLRDELKRDVPATRFFEHPTVRAFAMSLEGDGEVTDSRDNEAHVDRAQQRRQAIRRQGRRGNHGNG